MERKLSFAVVFGQILGTYSKDVQPYDNFTSQFVNFQKIFFQVNALKAICPATLDVLLKILSSPPTGGGMGAGGDDVRQNKTLLHDLVLKCMVRTVHVVHCCSPDQVQCVCVCVCATSERTDFFIV